MNPAERKKLDVAISDILANSMHLGLALGAGGSVLINGETLSFGEIHDRQMAKSRALAEILDDATREPAE